jgi:hypothetical protein
MIRLRFNSLAGTDPAIIGPAPFFRIEGTQLQMGAERAVIGRYFDHHWELGGRYVSSYECVEPVCLQFEGMGGETSETFGPYQQVRFPNGSCYADRLLFAELLQGHGNVQDANEGQWLHRGSAARWPSLLIRPTLGLY